MTDAERDAFLAQSFGEYRMQMVRQGRWTEATADRRLDALMRAAPPDRHAAGQRFYRIEARPGVVGGIWLQLDADVLFVMQLTLDAGYRRRGYGRATMTEVECMAREQGMLRLALNVFFDNEGALRLYESAGYRGIYQQMVKRLDG